MFEGIENGLHLIKDSIRVFRHHPSFLIPLLIVWIVYGSVILYLQYGLNWDSFTATQVFLIIFGAIFIFAFLLSFSCSMLLELIQQIESGKKTSLLKAFTSTIAYNLIKMIPLIIVWTIIWFILLVLQAIFSKRGKREKRKFTAENAARTLAGHGGSFSLSGAFFESLQKGVRMIVFLILPAMVWENLSFGKAVKKGISVFRAHFTEFATGFVLTALAAIILFLPPSLLFYISDKAEVDFPAWVWTIAIIYIAFAWSYTIYLEQMFVAELYLWDMKWEREIRKNPAKNSEYLAGGLRSVERPRILDEVPDLLEK